MPIVEISLGIIASMSILSCLGLWCLVPLFHNLVNSSNRHLDMITSQYCNSSHPLIPVLTEIAVKLDGLQSPSTRTRQLDELDAIDIHHNGFNDLSCPPSNGLISNSTGYNHVPNDTMT